MPASQLSTAPASITSKHTAKYKKPPARIRYEQSHPTISFRLDLETKKRLEIALEGQSFASFIKETLGVKEKEIKSLEEAYNNGHTKGDKKGYKKGSEDGYAEARKEFMVTYNCDVCGKPIVINSENAKKAAKKYMEDNGWGHTICHEKAKGR